MLQFFIGIGSYKLYMMHGVMAITQRHFTFVFLCFFNLYL